MKKFFTLFFIISGLIVNAQEVNSGNGLMQKDGKIYVVIAVVLTILIGLFLYVWNLDRKITKLEKND